MRAKRASKPTLATLGLALLLTACGGPPGSARLVDDTGLSDVADSGGWVAFIPADRASDFWSSVGGEPEEGLQYASVPVSRSAVEAVGGVVERVTEDGGFELGLTGSMLLCRLVGDAEPAQTRGCAEAEVVDGEPLTISWGEGGMNVGA